MKIPITYYSEMTERTTRKELAECDYITNIGGKKYLVTVWK